MFLFNKYYISKWPFAAIIIALLLVTGLGYYLFTNQTATQNNVSNLTNNSNNTNVNSPSSTTINTSNSTSVQNSVQPDYTDFVSSVKPASQVNLNQYKTIDFADGTSLLVIPKEIVTREPFNTAFKKVVSTSRVLARDKLFFIYNPSLESVSFLGVSLANLETISVQNKEYWVFSILGTDGGEEVYYSLPNFAQQTRLEELEVFPITEFKKVNPSVVEIIVNTAQRDERLVKYNLNFTDIQFNDSDIAVEFIDRRAVFRNRQPIVTIVE